MCDVIRQQPDGEDESGEEDDNELDPRVEIELEKLNKASIEINILEKELDEARAVFRQRLTDASKSLKNLGNSLGNNIDKARPYFEALSQSKKAQADCQEAAITYEKACELHKQARDTIAIAEEKLMNNPGMFDPAWQEMLNNANNKILEAEMEKMKKEAIHREATSVYVDLQGRATKLEKELKKSVNKARPYFEQRAKSLGYLEHQKILVQDLEGQYLKAKSQYSESLRNLEVISEEIHQKRQNKTSNHDQSPSQQQQAPVTERGECVGAEDATLTPKKPSRRKSQARRMSEEKIKEALGRRRRYQKNTSWRYRNSLLAELDIDFELDGPDDVDHFDAPRSPGAKSIDIGCVNMKYYDDYQVLDVSTFLERDCTLIPVDEQLSKNSTLSPRHGVLPFSTTHDSKDDVENKPAINSAMTYSEFENPSVVSPSRSRSASEFDIITTNCIEKALMNTSELHRSNTAPASSNLNRRDSKPVIISLDDLRKNKNKTIIRRVSGVNVNRFAAIEEQENDDEVFKSRASNGTCHITNNEFKKQDLCDLEHQIEQ